MITSVKIDGFKSFLDFELDLSPFLVLVGPNASGKSNLLDAIEFVADVVRLGPQQALLTQRRGTAQDFFHRFADGTTVDSATVELGMVVDSEHGPLAMRCRVRLQAGRKPHVTDCAAWVSSLDDLSWLHRRGASTQVVDELRKSKDQFRELEGSAYATLAAMEVSHPVWRLVAGECLTWRPLILDPARMRSPALFPDDAALAADGHNLAAVLYRLRERDVLWRVESDLAALIPGVAEIKPLLDDRRGEYDFDVVFADTGRVIPRLLSDGTLRVMGMLARVHDVDHVGLVAIEEIENGLHPGRVAELVRRLTRNLPDFSAGGLHGPLRQVLTTTHSPALVSALWPDQAGSLFFTEAMNRIEPSTARHSQVTRVLPLSDAEDHAQDATPWDVAQFLSSVREVD
jgi:predicted ATPase